MDSQKFCLKWDSFQSSVTSVFDQLRQDEELVDITLCCEGQSVRAHRMVLSACSPYFRELLKNKQCQQMLVFLKDTSASDLHAIVEFMYNGSVNVAQSQLASFIKTAEMLQIRGLSGDEEKSEKSPPPRPATTTTTNNGDSRARPSRAGSPPGKRRRLSASDPGSQAASRHHQQTQFQPPTQQLPAVLPGDPGSAQATPPPAASLPTGSSASRASDRVSSVATVPATSERESDGPHMQPPHPPVVEDIKREKQEVEIDLGSEDDASLDATLGYVADHEGGYPEHEMALATRAPPGDISGYGGNGPGSSQRHVTEDSASADTDPFYCVTGRRQAKVALSSQVYDGTVTFDLVLQVQQDVLSDALRNCIHDPFRYTCTVCGKVYKHRESLNHHRKKHEGLTTCTLCGKVCCIVAELRRHLELIHGLTQEEVRTIVPTKPKERILNFSAGAGLYSSSASAGGSNDPRVSERLPPGGIYSKLIESRATFDSKPDLGYPRFSNKQLTLLSAWDGVSSVSNPLWPGVIGGDAISGGNSKQLTGRRLEIDPSSGAAAENRKDSGEDEGRVASGANRPIPTFPFGPSISTDAGCENASSVDSVRAGNDVARPVSEAPS